MKRFLPLLACAGLALALLLCAGCGVNTGDSDAADSTASADTTKAKKPRKEKAIRVEAGRMRRGDLVEAVFADGILRTPREVEIRAKVGGELTEVLVRDGDRVRAGQVIARIDNREYRLGLEESRLRHIQALSQIAAEGEEVQADDLEALLEYDRQRDALDARKRTGELSAEEYEVLKLDLELTALKDGAFRKLLHAQRTGLAEARVSEERALLNLEYTEITAPFAGRVAGLTAVTGENISVNQALCSLYDNRRLEAVVNVLEADLADLVEGRRVLLAVPAVADTIDTTIDVISPRLDETSRTCEVILRFDNPEDSFRPGMFVRAEIAARIHPDLLMAPKDAVLIRDQRPLVFKVTDESRAQWLYVDIGRENSEWVEILKVHSGGSLAEGEALVITNHLTLAHEAKLNVKKTHDLPDRWERD